jgi:glycosyltransferase involved in cell wall biosynthesis/peptidoglycan/xylan/chitin deacetylase (PgdA/CDA1 family)
MKLSVVVPTFNRRDVLARTLANISAQDFPPEDLEVIVVIDGSTDGTASFLSDFPIDCSFRVLSGPHRGAGAARNVGIRAASAELVLLLDDDLIVSPGLFRAHCNAHANSQCSVVHGAHYVAPSSSRTILRWVLEQRCKDYYRGLTVKSQLQYPDEIGGSISVLSALANSSMPRDLLLRSGGFDEEIVAGEDLELGLRLWKAGAIFRYLPDAVVYEQHMKSSCEYLARQARALGTGDVIICRKHPEYRPYSLLSGFAEIGILKRWIWRVIACFPVPLVPLLSFPLRFEKLFYDHAGLRSLGVRLMRITERIAQLRGALGVYGSWKALAAEYDRHLTILMYHHVGPSRPGTYPSLTVSPGLFERQIKWLAWLGYKGISPSQWLKWRRGGTGLPKRPVLITFDDAYMDIAEYALPVLRHFGFSGAVYAVTQRFGSTNTWDEVVGCGTLNLMTAEQIRYWSGREIEFGAHSRTHADLTKLSETECEAEIIGSRDDLSALLGSPVISFAYPFGEYSDTVRDIVREQFDLGLSTNKEMNYLRTDPSLLRRTYVSPNDGVIGVLISVMCGEQERIRIWRGKLQIRTRLRRLMMGISRVFRSQSNEKSNFES